jgi:maltooligosyltrehalose trehalohydrolase
MEAEADGYFSVATDLSAGALYRYRLDGGDAFPDPASRFQPDGPHGPSQVVDPAAYQWKDTAWQGLAIEGQVIYEMHIGTFTRDGTWAAAAEQLPALAQIGVTVIEMMPVADFGGRFGWGYDGVNLYAPTRLYGSPDDLRRFIDRAHASGIAVILDVVYNHLGGDGNYLMKFADLYFSKKHTTDWGEAINFDSEGCRPVREFFVSNAGYWITEFHFDGLRIDATQNIYDDSERHVLADIASEVRRAAEPRATILIGENEPQQVKLIRPQEQGGYGLDGLWNDDLHHSAVVALTGKNDAYYTDYLGTAQEFVSAFKYGYLYQGQRYRWQSQRRGTPAFGVRPSAFVTFVQNHDQVANSARGLRIHELTTPGLFKAMTAAILLGPGTPMLFQGQEFASSTPFLYFSDMPEWLSKHVREGRAEFLAQWRSLRLPEMQNEFADPCSEDTFRACKLDHSEREQNQEIYRLHCDLLRIRREDRLLQTWEPGTFDGSVLSDTCFCLRIFSATDDASHRLLIVNLARDLHYWPSPEPLLAPPEGQGWRVVISTEDPRYGGDGTPPLETEDGWRIPGHAAVLLAPAARERVPRRIYSGIRWKRKKGESD